MKKICFCTPLKLGNFGDSTHIMEVWTRMPKLLNVHVYMLLLREDKRLLNINNMRFIKPPKLIVYKKIRFISRILSHIFIIFYCIFLSNLVLVYERQTMLNISGLLISKIKNIPLVYEVNTLLEYEKEPKFFNNIIIKMAKITEKLTIFYADEIIVVTEDLKQIFHDEYKIPSEKIAVLPNGANINLLYPKDKHKCREVLGLNQNEYIVCFVGGLGMGCGVKNLVEASTLILKELPNTLFLIVGDGPYKVIMEKKIRDLDVTNKFKFTGTVAKEFVPLYINSSDICLALYEIDDRVKKIGLSPIKMYEYMACAKPIIGSDGIKGIDIIENSRAGVLADINDPYDISRNIIRLLKNEKLRKEMGENGRKLIEEKYTWDINAKKVAAICMNKMEV